MIKVLAPAQRHPTNRATLAEFQSYWAECHGPLFANTVRLRRYVQHLTLPEAYGIDPAPTFDGVSMFWFDNPDPFDLTGETDQKVVRLQEAVREDDRQLFDRITSWPTHLKRAGIVAEERVIIEGEMSPSMVKGIFIASKLPGLSYNEFFEHWQEHHGPLAKDVPGLRRYVQNHAVLNAYAGGGQTHDGWSELWFDDLAALHSAVKSPQWQLLRDDGATLFAAPLGVGVARELVQKEFDWTYKDWGATSLDDDAIRQRLRDEKYLQLAEEVDAPKKIRTAAANGALAVWTDRHLVTIDESEIDARPAR